LLKDKKSVNPILLLGVVPNNEEAEKNIVNFRKKLQEFVSTAKAAEVKVDILTTIDHNPADGIVRTARDDNVRPRHHGVARQGWMVG